MDIAPVLPPGYAEAAYNLRHKKQFQRVKVSTILKLAWGIDADPETFTLAWIKRTREKHGLKPAVRTTFGSSDAWQNHVTASTEGWWNQIDYTPGCQGPADPAYCPLEQRLGSASPLPGGIILL